MNGHMNFSNSLQTIKTSQWLSMLKKIKIDANFAIKHGKLGPVYGAQWRDFFWCRPAQTSD